MCGNVTPKLLQISVINKTALLRNGMLLCPVLSVPVQRVSGNPLLLIRGCPMSGLISSPE